MKAIVLAYFVGMLQAPQVAKSHLRLCDQLPTDCLVCSFIIEAIEHGWWTGRIQ